MVVLDRRRRPCLPEKPFFGGAGRGQPRQHRFERDQALERGVFGPEDDAHAAAAKDAEDAIRTQPADLVGLLRRREEVGQFHVNGGRLRAAALGLHVEVVKGSGCGWIAEREGRRLGRPFFRRQRPRLAVCWIRRVLAGPGGGKVRGRGCDWSGAAGAFALFAG